MKYKVKLIGASGFVGSRLISLLKERHIVTNLDKRSSPFYPEITHIGDIRDQVVLDKELNGQDVIILLAAEHRDDVHPVSLYYDVNVQGTKNVLSSMDRNNVKNIIFTSSVAVYGLNKNNPDESHSADPFNDYGESKRQAEEALRAWYLESPEDRSLTIIRPTVIFGERNRGNVYNLLAQIASGKFLMIGKGNNKKSMAYVGNVASFIEFQLHHLKPGCHIYNYVDKPDFDMNELVSQVEKSLNRKIPSVHFPYWSGMLGGYIFDMLGLLSGKNYPISSVRVKKFCATTQFEACSAHNTGFKAPYSLEEGLNRTLQYEFLKENSDQNLCVSSLESKKVAGY